jgi:hypothetical protein
MLLMILAVLAFPGSAQDEPSVDDVVALVLTVPEIANGLDNLSFYETLAYNSRNTYGIWQVEFEDGEGNTVAWAQVQPSTGKIYAWEAYFGADDAQYEAILPVYQAFVANHPDVRALIRGINKDEIYPWWDSDAEAWVSWIGDAGDAIMVAVQFDGGAQDSAENPELTQLWFPNLPSYDEWWVASSSEAVAIAFQEVAIATALRGKSWTTEAELTEGRSEVWTVQFVAGGETIVTAEVDIDSGEILDYEISG